MLQSTLRHGTRVLPPLQIGRIFTPSFYPPRSLFRLSSDWTSFRLHSSEITASSVEEPTSKIPLTSVTFGESVKKQSVDFTTLSASLHELQQWIPSRVEQVIQWHQQCIAFRLRNKSSMTWMYISWHPIAARVNLGDSPQRGAAAEAYSFGENLNRALRGLVLLSATLPVPFERVVCLTFSASLDGIKQHSLWCEIMGRHSNVVLTDRKDEIRLCAQQIGSKQSSVRQLQVGSLYKAPPSQDGIHPRMEISKEEFIEIIDRVGTHDSRKNLPLASVLVRAFQGVGPCLAQDLLLLSNIDPSSKYESLTSSQTEALLDNWKSWLRQLTSNKYAPRWCPERKRYSMVGLKGLEVDSVHELLDSYYRSMESDNDTTQLTHEIRSCIKKNLTRMENKRKKLMKQLKDSEGATEIQKKGELIISNLHNYLPGRSSISVVDWETQETIEVALDSTKSAVECAEDLFKKAKKLRRAKDSVQPLMEKVDQELEYIKEVEESVLELEASDDEEDNKALIEIQEELITGGYLKPPPDHHLAMKAQSKAKKASKKPMKSPPESEGCRLFWSPNEFRILIGRNNKQNDEISKVKGRPGDYWFHARGVPGAHVLLKLDGKGKDPEEEDLICAARLAAYYSKAREEGKATVSMTKAENVSKPKGAPPGLVHITKETSLQVKPSNSLAFEKH